VRYEVTIDYDSGLPSALLIEFRAADGETRRLRFIRPQMEEFGPLRIPGETILYVADMGRLGWEKAKSIEVGAWEEDHSVLFWAASVEEVA
jgi:hypothetical protein